MEPGTGPERTFIETARRAQIVAAAIDTIAEVGYARASLGLIAKRIGISRGLISYHFASKDELIAQVVADAVDQGKEFMWPPIFAASTGPGVLRAYIESGLAFVREHPNHKIALVEISRNDVSADGQPGRFGDPYDEAVRALEALLAHFQAAGELRTDFDPRSMAIAIRAAMDAAGSRVGLDQYVDIDDYAREIVTLFDLATRSDTPTFPGRATAPSTR
jgi:TetR/AcrR family transcriptional regulator, fatty acid metabolism regulator protein